jgi:hypothetical protein
MLNFSKLNFIVELARLKQEDKFGPTHSSYYQTKVSSIFPTQDEEPDKKKKADKEKNKKLGMNDL